MHGAVPVLCKATLYNHIRQSLNLPGYAALDMAHLVDNSCSGDDGNHSTGFLWGLIHRDGRQGARSSPQSTQQSPRCMLREPCSIQASEQKAGKQASSKATNAPQLAKLSSLCSYSLELSLTCNVTPATGATFS
eukprot:2544087-Amphidinium_carterae.1